MYVGYGEGRGLLSASVASAVGSSFLTADGESTHYIIDRISPRKKMEKSATKVSRVSPQSASFHRLCVDLADVDLAAICPDFVGIGKHVCGAATDLSLRSRAQ